MKKVLILLMLFVISLAVFSCEKKANTTVNSSTKDIHNLEENVGKRKICVAYFSLDDDDTKAVAEKFKEALDADLIEIVPKVAYTEEDLNYDNPDSRIRLEAEFNPFGDDNVLPEDDYTPEEDWIYLSATRSQVEKRKTLTALPEIEKTDANNYQIIVIGFPVWHENAPKVIYTFLKDLKDKIIVPFCTNGEMEMIDQYLSNFADNSVRVMSGKSFDRNVEVDDIEKWVKIISADFDVR